MNFITVAWGNLRRNPVRSILTGLSLAISALTLTVVMGLDRGYSTAVNEELVNKTGVHLYITKEGCPIEAASVIAQGGLSPLYVEENLVTRLESHPNIDAILPFKLFTVTTEDALRTDIFMGVTGAIETVRPEWKFRSGGWFTSASSVILGAEIALLENLAVGDRTYSEEFDREFTVSGILHRNYSQDDATIFVPLNTAQELVNRENKLSAIALKLKDISLLDQSRNEIRAMMPPDNFVLGSKELGSGILQFFQSTRVIMFVMVAVAFVISVFGIINTMLMAVLERRKEIAYLKCVGAGKRDILKLITFETLLICIAGSIAGSIAGLTVSPYFGDFMRSLLVAYSPSRSIAEPDLTIAALAFAVCTSIGLICSLYPAFRASGIVPMEVLRND
jgi:putative ABC transport system permease protein